MNRLDQETSPYLRQHVDNPVHWQPWDDDALAQAREQDRPILLSIGYSACHWCHVMAHESFEDEDIAALMNRYFVNIKVDREERPDLDQTYQLAHQLLTGRGGGWPLTVFLDPQDLAPFFAGTYYPPTGRLGAPGLDEVLPKIAAHFAEKREALREQNQRLKEALEEMHRSDDGGSLDLSAEEAGLALSVTAFDETHGGFGGAPKFPQAPILAWLSEMAIHDPGRVLPMLDQTLEKMADRGLYDHLGEGFFRYTVDRNWSIPHFEKMLYDNALLLPIYAERARHRPRFQHTVEGVAKWLLKDMAAEDGGFFAALDADADGEEGSYYVWQRDEVEKLLEPDEAAVVSRYYGLDQLANFEGRAWHLRRREMVRETAAALDLPLEQVATLLASARVKLLAHRAQRPAPGLDDKRITAWNGYAIAGLARAGRVLGRDEWIDKAAQTMDFVREKLWRDDRLWRSHTRGETRHGATLEDYAAVVDGGIELFRANHDPAVLGFTTRLLDQVIEYFEDREHGGFFTTPSDAPVVMRRLRLFHDDATPSANGQLLRALIILGHLTGNTSWLKTAERGLNAGSGDFNRSPRGYPSMLRALREWLAPRPQVILLYEEPTALEPWNEALKDASGEPRVFALAVSEHDGLPGMLAQLQPQAGAPVTAYLCLADRCLPPVTAPEILLQRLGDDSATQTST